MLVVFKSTAAADITMFGDVAQSLLKMMGQSGDVPGAILAPDVPTALSSLETALAKIDPDDVAGSTSDDDETPIALSTRAQPLIKLLDASIAANADVIWES